MWSLLTKFFFSLSLFLSLTASCFAGIKEGQEAYDKEDYEEALKEFMPLAEAGEAEAQYYMAFLYSHGNSVPKSRLAAFKWFEKAALQNHTKAMYWAGLMLFTGRGDRQDNQQALTWITNAADQGFSEAQAMLGRIYLMGVNGVAQNCAAAKEWLDKADALNNAMAQKILAQYYFDGHCQKSDPQTSMQWLQKSAENKDVGAAYTLGTRYLLGIGSEPDRAQAIKWLNLAKDRGHSQAKEIIELYNLKPEELFSKWVRPQHLNEEQ